MIKVAILLFDDVEELDAVGPYQVFGSARMLFPKEIAVETISSGATTQIRGVNGLAFNADFVLSDEVAADVLIVPGGIGSRAVAADRTAIAAIRKIGARASWIGSVCTGVRITLEAGFSIGKKVTTHWSAIEEIRKDGRAADVLDDVRFVVDGNMVHSSGVSAGIDMSLWLAGRLLGCPSKARAIQHQMEYYPAPPYQFMDARA